MPAETTDVTINGATCRLPAVASTATGGGFAFGLYKAGSTMLFDALQRLLANSNVRYLDLNQCFRRADIVLEQSEVDDKSKQLIGAYLDRPGIVYGGWREFPTNYVLPLRPDSRTCLLVRDPRDILTSHYFSLKYSHTTEGPGGIIISRARKNREGEDIDTFALRMAPPVVRYFRDYRALASTRLHMRRYEDIIFDKERYLRELCEHLELEVAASRIAKVVQTIDIRPDAEDIFAHVRQVTPGDHANKLKPETIEQLNVILRDALSEYNYRSATA